jgi:hypothetical protein
VAKLRVRINKRRPSHFANVGSLYIRFRRRHTEPNQRRAAASNPKLAGSGMGSALAVAMAPIGTESRFAGCFGLACRIGFEILIRTREFDLEGFPEKPHRPVCITM